MADGTVLEILDLQPFTVYTVCNHSPDDVELSLKRNAFSTSPVDLADGDAPL